MGIATLAFWAGRNKYVHVPPTGLRRVLEVLREDGCAALGRLSGIYVFVAVFWSLYDQSGSAWVQQAERMDRHFLGVEWLASQVRPNPNPNPSPSPSPNPNDGSPRRSRRSTRCSSCSTSPCSAAWAPSQASTAGEP